MAKEVSAISKRPPQGRYPVSLSAKFSLFEKHSWLPDITLVSYLNLPFLSDTDENKYWAPAFVLALERKINKITVAANGGINWDAFEIGHNYQATTSLNFDLTEKWKVFAEYYGQYQKGGSPMNNFDAGILYMINDNNAIRSGCRKPTFRCRS